MHTCFIIKNNGRVSVRENNVQPAFTKSFGRGKPFTGIGVGYTSGGVPGFMNLQASYNGAKYLGGGVCAMSFSSATDFKGSVSITSLCILSDGGEKMNDASQVAFSAVGETEISVVAYVKINASDIELSPSPERLFEVLFGVRDYALEGFVDYYGSEEGLSASLVREDGRVVISIGVPSEAVGRKLLIFCDKGHVLTLNAKTVAAGEEVLSARLGVVGPIAYGVEITEIAGSDVSLSDIARRNVGKAIGELVELPSPHGYRAERTVASADGKHVAVITDCGVTLLDYDGTFTEKGVFLPDLQGEVKDCFFFGSKLFVLKETLLELDLETCETLAEHTLTVSAERVFVTDAGIVLLCGKSGFYAFSATSGLSQMFSVTDTDAIFHFDTPSQTLTMAGANGVRQFRFVDSVYYEKTYSIQISSAHANGVCGRWGSAVVTFSNGYVLFDLNGKLSRTVNRQNLRSVRAFSGGSTLALQGKDSTVIADITAEGEAERFSVPSDSPVCVLDFGIVTQAGFYPYSVVEKQFTLPDLSSGGEFHVYTETPYFSSETHNFIFEATL